MVKIYTKTGDSGETSLWGGKRVPKDSLIISAIGAVDELNASLGVAESFSKIPKINKIIDPIQANLFNIGAALAGSKLNLTSIEIAVVEQKIDKLSDKLPELRNFILPAGTKGASLWHFSRTVCRRAERALLALDKKEKVDPEIKKYINRLSDLLFVLARTENKTSRKKDKIWKNTQQ